MKYLLSLDISKWDPQTIPSTKMKVDIMMKQLPDPVRFVINHISSWSKDHVDKPIFIEIPVFKVPESTPASGAVNEPPQTIEPAVARPESEHVVSPNPNPGSERTSGKGKEVERAPPQQDSPPTMFHFWAFGRVSAVSANGGFGISAKFRQDF
ncbi:hypothetical protein C1646_776380 [Rhizophagus diaphanus]|nr:hypothetical protein C1646_776380 [Rhizophagus diaphanus] [Rhizophagus sp. MUCL 43196]